MSLITSVLSDWSIEIENLNFHRCRHTSKKKVRQWFFKMNENEIFFRSTTIRLRIEKQINIENLWKTFLSSKNFFRFGLIDFFDVRRSPAKWNHFVQIDQSIDDHFLCLSLLLLIIIFVVSFRSLFIFIFVLCVARERSKMPSDVVIDGARCLERIRRLYAVWNVSGNENQWISLRSIFSLE